MQIIYDITKEEDYLYDQSFNTIRTSSFFMEKAHNISKNEKYKSKCNESCKTCTKPKDTDCILCIDGYKLIGQVCINVSDNCFANKHCDFDNSEGNEILNYINDLPSYNAFHNDKGGGAIRLINYGFSGENAVFKNCYSENGGGGEIYI